ncbi:hypothetical protein KC19_2G112600 [Ceratodon purpureus]|uniref:Myb/SANT-like DNA-binding domain-containing protein n=1 Tax=Ceratodon purpureus TaxID=3225 RepID=A0A8T0IV82_CERPU|nr:hypothetical protein KC19_2G112600 [Ceratodon purpureus]
MEAGDFGYLPENAAMNWPVDHRLDMEHPVHHQPTSELAQANHRQPEQLPSEMPNFRKRKITNSAKPKRAAPGTRQRAWTDDETSALLEFVNSPEFRPQRRSRNKRTVWEPIVEALQVKFGPNDPAITVKRCKERMKTLTGDRYFGLVTSKWEEMKTENGDLTDDDLRELIVSHGLRVDWYEAIKAYKGTQAPCVGKGRSRVQMLCDLDGNLIPDRPSSSCSPPVNDGPSEPFQAISKQNAGKSMKEQIATRFNSMEKSLRSTLLDLAFCADYQGFFHAYNEDVWPLSKICEWLSMVQKRRSLSIYKDVIALNKLGLVKREPYDDEDEESDDELSSYSWIDFGSLGGYEKFFKKAMIKNPAYDTRRSIHDNKVVTFDSASAPSELTVLFLDHCEQLEVVDLSGFPKLRSLTIWRCGKLREMIGWECLLELGRLEIYKYPLLDGYPPLSKIRSLREVRFCENYGEVRCGLRGGELDVSGCVRLQKLEIQRDEALSSIRGLEDLHSLTELELWECKALQNLPDIGHMKDLTHLSIGKTQVEEIRGVEKLLSLKELDCQGSKLKTLPDLGHLPHLQSVHLYQCPVVDDPSSPYYQQQWCRKFNTTDKHVDVSDASDSECHLSDEEV